MFKLESYLTPWLLSYLDKYVKLKPEDFKISLWGGDVVFNKLDLRLNVVENLTNIPITFKSGLIHELRIHLPWTRITSEPVVVTINTLEFVAKLKDKNSSNLDNSKVDVDIQATNAANQSPSQQQQQPPTQQQQVPAGYIQNLINKILSNICIIVNNVIVKFVEDDIVLSINMKSAECFSVNHQWEKSFVELNAHNNHLRKIIQLNDVTICLDKLENRGNSKINYYQDPLIYRFSIQSRLDFIYNMKNLNVSQQQQQQNLNNPQLSLIKLNFYCRKFDFSVSDQQLPMVIRLIELILAIVDDTLVLPENDATNDSLSSPSILSNQTIESTESIKLSKSTSNSQISELKSEQVNFEVVGQEETIRRQENGEIVEDQQGWISWAWSYVPAIIPQNDTNESTDQIDQSNNQVVGIILGVYIDELNVSFKLIEYLNHQSNSAKAYHFTQFLILNSKGIAIEMNNRQDFSHLIIGVSYISVKSVGECCCRLCPKPNSNEIIFLTAGNQEEMEEKTFHYLSDSLFDILDENLAPNEISNEPSLYEPDNQQISSDEKFIKESLKSRDKFGNLDESYGSRRFGAFLMDQLFWEKSKNTSAMSSSSSTDLDQQSNSNSSQDIFFVSFIFYSFDINLSANFFHRLFKMIDKANSHNYTRPYSSFYLNQSNDLTKHTMPMTTTINTGNDSLTNSKLNIQILAKKFEKYIPIINTTFTVKDPTIKFFPYSHFLVSTSQEVNYECYFYFNVKYIYFNITRPLDEKSLFDVISNLPNPSKKLTYDSYVHNQIIVDSLKVNLIIVDFFNSQKKNFKHEFCLLEPCYFELHFSNVIMTPEMWNKQYFPLNEFIIELPMLKLNLHKQMIFILNDYLDNYLFPILSLNIFNDIKKPNITKAQMKQAKLRQIIYKRLLEDILQQSKLKQNEMVRICLTDFKFKLSMTKIMQIFQLNLNVLNVYLVKNESTDELIQILDTSSNKNKIPINNDFLVLRAQLPLKVDVENSYIPDPIFIYANVNETNIQLRDEFIHWLMYKPTRGDDELVNLLIMELFDDSIDRELNENLNHIKTFNQKELTTTGVTSTTTSVIYHQQKGTKSIKSASISSRSSINNKNLRIHEAKSNDNASSNQQPHRPTLIDTYYDLLKSLHLQIFIKPVTLMFKSLDNLKNDLIIIEMPQLELKSAGTKCDLQEELITSSTKVELPCTYLKACEKTSNKLPWLIELKGFRMYHYNLQFENYEIINPCMFTNQMKTFIITSIDLNALFTVKPVYNHHDNLLSSLSIIFNLDVQKKIDFNIRQSQLSFFISWLMKFEMLIKDFKFKIDYKDFEPNINYDEHGSFSNTTNIKNLTADMTDDNKSISFISILREHELNSFDAAGNKILTDDFQDQEDYLKRFTSDNDNENDHCSLSTGEFSSTSSSSSFINNHNKLKRRQLKRLITTNNKDATTMIFSTNETTTIAHQSSIISQSSYYNKPLDYSPSSTDYVYITREKNEEQVNLNFTMFFSISSLNLILTIDDKANTVGSSNHLPYQTDYDMIRFSFQKVKSQLDVNNTFQKFLFMMKKMQINNESSLVPNMSNNLENIIFTSDSELINKNLYLVKPNQQQNQTNNSNKNEAPIQDQFLELTITRALTSNLNKRLNEMTSPPINENIKSSKKSVGSKKTTTTTITSLNAQKWISEINLTINNLDFSIHLSKFDVLFQFYLNLTNIFEIDTSENKPSELNKHDKNLELLIPIIKPTDIPLLNIDINRIRLFFPTSVFKTEESHEIIVAQILRLNLTSQVENPVIRNFINNSTQSFNIYNKAKSNGSLYRPGFLFEDRQYSFEMKNVSLFQTNSINLRHQQNKIQCLPLIDCFDVKAIIGLPILLNKRLINGYVLEINVPTPDLSFYFCNSQINLITNIINENVGAVSKYTFKTKESPKKGQINSLKQIDLEIIPLDILLTAENINFYFYMIDSSQDLKQNLLKSSLFLMKLTQPYICLIMHEKYQKFELSIFDINLKRSTPSSSKSFLIQNDEYKLPTKSEFIIPVIETKQLEANPKTGIIAGFFSFKITNFALLFCQKRRLNRLDSSNNSNSSQIIENSIIQCVCSNCSKCYEFKVLKNSNDIFRLKTNKNIGFINGNEMTNDESSSILKTQFIVERPLKVKANFIFYSQINEFLDTLIILKNNQRIESSHVIEEANAKSNDALVQILFDLNIHLVTSQIIGIFEIQHEDSLKLNNLQLSLNSLNVHLNRFDDDLDELEDHDDAECLSPTKHAVRNYVSVQLNDLQCKIQFILNDHLNSSIGSSDYLDFIGPVTLKAFLVYSSLENEFYSTVNFDSFNVFFNRQLLQFFENFLKTFNEKQIEAKKENFDQNEQIEYYNDTFKDSILRYQDDLRNGLLKYTIIDDNYLKIAIKSNNSNNLWLLSHIRLPKINEAVCIDDLSLIAPGLYKSSICWRYSSRRALINLKILPLPFVGGGSTTGSEHINTINENSMLTDNSNKSNLKCYLEYLNECTKVFIVVKEFSIQEGTYTNVLENINQQSESFSYKNLTYAKVWRIRLSDNAKRYIYASSLLASTLIDSIELNQNTKTQSKLHHSHLELNINNIQFKLNTVCPQSKKTVSLKTADLFSIDLNDISLRVLNNCYYNSTLDKISSYCSINSIGQMAIEYCEYRFLTNRSLIDPMQFKIFAEFNLMPSLSNLNIDLDIDTINLSLSQSALISIKQLINELSEENNSKHDKKEEDWLPHYYLIVNDTNLAINAKQFDTEESCLIQAGQKYAYTWRTHKKPQLLQLFISRYKITSKPFQCNENGFQEIIFTLNDNSNCFVSLLINIEDKTSSFSFLDSIEHLHSYKKTLYIQSKLIIANYLNLDIEKLQISYLCNEKEYEMELKEKIGQTSRSNSTYEIVQQMDEKRDQLEINLISINNSKLLAKNYDSSFYLQLKKGILCFDSDSNMKYWLNLYIQEFKPYKTNKKIYNISSISPNALAGSTMAINMNESNSDKIIQYVIVLTPLFIFCSYLPYDLSIELLNKKQDKVVKQTSKHSLRAHSVSYLQKDISSVNNLSNEYELQFGHVSDLLETKAKAKEEENYKFWFENEIEHLIDNYNITKCKSDKNKLLIYNDLFKYSEIMDESKIEDDEFLIANNIKLNVSSSAIQTNNNLTASSDNNQAESNAVQQQEKQSSVLMSESKFLIEKKFCWSFSKTIRIDIKPICLLVNKTNYSLKIIEKYFEPNSMIDTSISQSLLENDLDENKESGEILIRSIDSNGGQLCLHDIGSINNSKLIKKFKFIISLDEYSINELKFKSETDELTSNKFDLIKQEMDYESGWIEIRDEPVAPFYRERNQYKMNVLYANKCWLDLKLYPATQKSFNRLQLIHLLLRNDEWSCFNNLDNADAIKGNNKLPTDLSIRLITIETKILINNKTDYDIKLQVNDDYLLNHSLLKKSTERFIETEDLLLKSNNFLATGEVVSIKNSDIMDSSKELKDQSSETEKDDLYYLYFKQLENGKNFKTKINELFQSKPIVLTLKEKAIKQIASSGNIDENLLISRQCFSLYWGQGISKAFICSQKLLANKNGRLIITIREDKSYLIELFNSLNVDLYVWPRISSNFIFENYVKNCIQINEKELNEMIKEGLPTSPVKSKSFNSFDRSASFMHLIPSKRSFKFNYDFIGTNHFPIENIGEQIFFMFAISKNETKLFDLSPNLCRIYETSHEITFEENKTFKFNYIGNEEATVSLSNQINVKRRVITLALNSSSLSFSGAPNKRPFLSTNLNVNIECFALALNDDCLSQIYQTEILRLRSDKIEFNLTKPNIQKTLISFTCQHLQLDNQMFSLDEDSTSVDSFLSKSAQKFDFPVIFIPRESSSTKNSESFKQKAKKQNSYYKSLESSLLFNFEKANMNKKFLQVNLTFLNSNEHDEEIVQLSEISIQIKPFDVYLEDYLIYNLVKIGIEFLELYSFNTNQLINPCQSLNRNSNLTQTDLNYFKMQSDMLDILVFPLVMTRKVNIGRIDCLLSLQTSLKLYLATYKMPILFDNLVLNGLPLSMMSSPQLIKILTGHYLTSLILRAGWLLGSLDLIGTPTAFIQQVSNGVYDFLQMPYRGLKDQGPTGFLRGFSSGSVSLIRNMSSGTITSLTSFAAFVSRNMDILSFDPHHLARQEQLRHQSNSLSGYSDSSFGTSLLQVSSSFIITIMGAIGGLAEQPLQSVHNSDSLIKGVSKGLIGLITKPVGAVAELVNQTGQGLLRITGGSSLMPPIELRLEKRAVNKEFARFPISITKCLWKLISTNSNNNPNESSSNSFNHRIHLNSMIDAVSYDSSTNKISSTLSNVLESSFNLTSCYLILSDEILYVVDKNEDMLLRAFYLSQIDISIKQQQKNNSIDSPISNVSEPNSSTLIVTLLSNEQNKLFYENNIDRLVDYVNHQSNRNEGSSVVSKTGDLVSNDSFEQIDYDIMNHINKVIQNKQLLDNPSFSEIFLKLNKSMPDYYRYSNVVINAYLNYFHDLPCTSYSCGSNIIFLNKEISRSITKPSNVAKQQQHNRQKSNSEIVLNLDSINDTSSKHIRQLSGFSEMPKIHRTNDKTNSTFGSTNSNSVSKISQLISQSSFDQLKQTTNKQQQFHYYVDPRISKHFINIFNSLKRKATNKGFQF